MGVVDLLTPIIALIDRNISRIRNGLTQTAAKNYSCIDFTLDWVDAVADNTKVWRKVVRRFLAAPNLPPLSIVRADRNKLFFIPVHLDIEDKLRSPGRFGTKAGDPPIDFHVQPSPDRRTIVLLLGDPGQATIGADYTAEISTTAGELVCKLELTVNPCP